MSENLQNRMLLRLFFGEGWQPIVRMDQFPTLCKLGGLTTIEMEMAFISLMFLPKGRYVAAAGGLLFHWLVKLFLNISFWPIQVYYVAFIIVEYSIRPEDADRNPIGRQLMEIVKTPPSAPAPP